MRINILGALEMVHNGRTCTPTAPKVRWALALLVMRANHIVGIDALIEELWGDNPPRSAITTAQTYIYQLRRRFDREGLATRPEDILETRPPGYVLHLPEDSIDVNVFTSLTEQGRVLLAEGRPDEASERLHKALALWHGPALADVPVGRLLEAHVVHLNEQRIRALELRIQADNEMGRQRELIPELRSLVASHPLNEWFHGQLIEALNVCGRRGEALRAYQDLRDVLNDELGLEPSNDLQELQRRVLSSGDTTRREPLRHMSHQGAPVVRWA